MPATKVMNHSEYQRKIKSYTAESLRHIIQDCKEVIELQSEFNPNIGYYQDEMLYCQAELARRAKLKRPAPKYRFETAMDNVIGMVNAGEEETVIADELQGIKETFFEILK